MAISKIKSTSLQDDIHLQGDVVDLPGGFTSERTPAPEAGMIRYNTTVRKMEIYNGTSWDALNPQSLQIALSIALA
jgi:hypothetical protein